MDNRSLYIKIVYFVDFNLSRQSFLQAIFFILMHRHVAINDFGEGNIDILGCEGISFIETLFFMIIGG